MSRQLWRRGFTADHVAAFQRYGTKRVLIAYDRDDAGDKAADKLAEQLIALGIECLRALPEGMDANSTALKLTPAQHSLGLMLRQAEWMGRPAQESENKIQESISAASPTVEISSLAAGVEIAAAAVVEPELPSPELQQDELSIVQGEPGVNVSGVCVAGKESRPNPCA